MREVSLRLSQAVYKASQFTKQKFDGEIVYNGGGNAILEIDGDLNKDTEDEVKEVFFKALYGSKTTMGKLSNPDLLVHSIPIQDDTQFQKNRSKLLTEAGRIKRRIHTLELKELITPTVPCVSCYVREGTVDPYEDEDSEESSDLIYTNKKLCEICHSFKNQGSKRLNDIISNNKIQCNLKELKVNLLQFIAGIPSDQIKGKTSEGSFENSESKNKIGIILLDGNLFGKFFSKLSTKDELKSFSDKIDKTVNDIYTTIIANLQDQEDKLRLELGKVYIGGDDVRIITPATLAFPIAYNFINEFSKTFSKENLTLSAGIVFTKTKVPFMKNIELADSLLKSAKVLAKPENKGGIDFEVVFNTTTPNSIKTRRKETTENQLEYSGGYGIGDNSFLETIINTIPELAEIKNVSKTQQEEIKEKYLIPLKTTLNIADAFDQNLKHQEMMLFTLRMQARHTNNGVLGNKGLGYRLAYDLIDLENNTNHIKRGIDLISSRFGL